MRRTTVASPRDAADRNSWVRRSSARASAEAASALTRSASPSDRSWVTVNPDLAVPPRADPSADAWRCCKPTGAAARRAAPASPANSRSTISCARLRKFSSTPRVPTGKSLAMTSYLSLGTHSRRDTVSVRTDPEWGTSVKNATSPTASPSVSRRPPPCTDESRRGMSSGPRAPAVPGASTMRLPDTQTHRSATWSPSSTIVTPGINRSTWDAASTASTNRWRAPANR